VEKKKKEDGEIPQGFSLSVRDIETEDEFFFFLDHTDLYSRMSAGTAVGGIMPTSVTTMPTNLMGVKSYLKFNLRGCLLLPLPPLLLLPAKSSGRIKSAGSPTSFETMESNGTFSHSL
jgi:hypothetical protein